MIGATPRLRPPGLLGAGAPYGAQVVPVAVSPEGVFSSPGLDIDYQGDPNFHYGKSASARPEPFSGVVFHHTADKPTENLVNYGKTVDQQRGGAFGYHFYIAPDGRIIQGAPLTKRTNHVKPGSETGLTNRNAIGISLVGAHDGETQAQIEAAKKLTDALMGDYDLSKFYGHGEMQKDRMASEGALLAGYFRDPNNPEVIGAETMAALGLGPQGTAPAAARSAPMSGGGGQPGLIGSAGSDRMSGLLGNGRPESFSAGLREAAKSGALFEGLATAFNSLRHRPDPGLNQMMAQRSARRDDMQSRNRTAEWLRSQGMGQYADAIEAGGMSAAQAMQLAQQEREMAMAAQRGPEPTAMMRNYEFFLSQGMSPEDAMAAVRGGTSVNVNTGDAGPEIGTIPQGYAVVPDGTNPSGYRLEAIPGGPAEAERQQAEAERIAQQSMEALSAEQTSQNADMVLEDIGQVKTIVETSKLPTTGAVGALMSNFGGTAAHDVQQLTLGIRANIGFDRLQQMRDASPTGGALGSVTERELERLDSVLGSLAQSQSEEQFLRNLDRLEQVYSSIKRKAEAYPNANEFGFSGGQSAPTVPNADPLGLR